MELVIKGGTLVTSDKCFTADILVREEKIAQIAEHIEEEGREVINAEGKLVFPGFIDTHTHFDLEGACNTADDFYTGSKAAIIGGTTMILDFATQDRGTSSLETLEKWHKKAGGNSSCDYGFHMSYTEWNDKLSEELPLMVKEGITSFKLYMAYDNLLVGDDIIEQVLGEVKQIGGIVGTHCEVGAMVKQGIQNQLEQGHFAPKYHPLSRPEKVEQEAVKRYLEAAARADAPVNIVHLSTRLALEEAMKAREKGQKVYIETCPQYLLLDDSAYDSVDSFEGAKYVLSPPLRKKSDIKALWEALEKDLIETVGTDHCSFNYRGDKEIGKNDFSKIPNGIPGVENRPALLYTYGVGQGKITLNQMVKILSENASKLFGLFPRKGTLAVGSDADIVIWDTQYSGEIRASVQMQNVDYTPYEGMQVNGRAETVLLRGRKVVYDAKIAKENHGKYIKRGKSIYF